MWQKRRIGRTNLEVTALGLGTATLGGPRVKVPRPEAEAMLQAAWDAGVRYFDTAPLYGVGTAERCVGDTLRERPRDEWVLSSKVGRLLHPRRQSGAAGDSTAPLPFDVVYDYSYDGILRSVDDSYQRLGMASIDILLVHDIGAYLHGPETHAAHMRTLKDSGYRALDELKRAGVVSAIGIGVNEREALMEALAFADWDVFLLAGRYTLLEQAPLDDLLPLCAARGTSIVVGGPLNSGILAGRETWNYQAAPPEVVSRVEAIRAICDHHAVPLAAAALQFPLAHPQVAAIIPGPRSAAEFIANLALMNHKIPAAFWAELRSADLLHAAAPTPDGAGPSKNPGA
jgi:D-threo-aldose 1-dehydrogenase